MSEGNQENAARLGRLSIVGFLRKHTCYSTMPESGKVHTRLPYTQARPCRRLALRRYAVHVIRNLPPNLAALSTLPPLLPP